MIVGLPGLVVARGAVADPHRLQGFCTSDVWTRRCLKQRTNLLAVIGLIGERATSLGILISFVSLIAGVGVEKKMIST